jgi:hypothetical protein
MHASMQECGFSWQRAFKTVMHENEPTSVEGKIGLARLAILERFVSPASIDRQEEDALFEALDALRALDWQRFSRHEELISSDNLSFPIHH